MDRRTLPGPTSSQAFFSLAAKDFPAPSLDVLSTIRFLSMPGPIRSHVPPNSWFNSLNGVEPHDHIHLPVGRSATGKLAARQSVAH
jgi:hypothetical protein